MCAVDLLRTLRAQFLLAMAAQAAVQQHLKRLHCCWQEDPDKCTLRRSPYTGDISHDSQAIWSALTYCISYSFTTRSDRQVTFPTHLQVKVRRRGSDTKFVAQVLAVGTECDIGMSAAHASVTLLHKTLCAL